MPPELTQGEEGSNPKGHGMWTSLLDGAGPVLEWMSSNRIKTGILGGVCLLAVGGLIGIWFMAATAPDEEVSLDIAMEALDDGDYVKAKEMAEKLRGGAALPDDPLGGPAFVLGAATAQEADDAWTADKKDLYLLSARYLEEARDLGFPPGRLSQGLFMLGRSFYLSHQMAASRPVLLEALTWNPHRESEIHRLLADAYLGDANPKFPEALEHNAEYLSDSSLLSDERHKGLLQRAEILLQLGNTAECLRILDQIPAHAASSPEAIVTRGRVLMSEARALQGISAEDPKAAQSKLEAHEKYQSAMKTLRLVQGRDTLTDQATGEAMYLIGVCYMEIGDYPAALKQFARTCRTYTQMPEAFAADLRTAEILRRLGQDDDALDAYRQSLRAVTDVDTYANQWLPLDELRAALLKAYEHYRDIEDFERCLKLTRLFYPVMSASRAIELMAETHRLQGRKLLNQDQGLSAAEAEELRHRGRTELRRAGQTYRQLAEFRKITNHYPDDLWNSGECYLDGRGYSKAIVVLREYLATQSRRRQPRALAYLGDALLAEGRLDEALSAYDECIQFHPRDAASFRARLAAANARLEKGEFDKAIALLEGNINGMILTPTSSEWRDSLFTLGRTLHVTGRYEDALERLENAIDRYPDSPQTIEARYLAADSYRRIAKAVEAELDDDLLESTRLLRVKKISESLHAALSQYQETRELLSQRQQAVELTPLEKSILRNCYFCIGGVLFDLRQYAEAVNAYFAASGRYQNVPEVLEAYVQIARAQTRLDRPEEARRAMEQATVILNRMKDGESAEQFSRTTIRSPEDWSEFLDWLKTTL